MFAIRLTDANYTCSNMLVGVFFLIMPIFLISLLLHISCQLKYFTEMKWNGDTVRLSGYDELKI